MKREFVEDKQEEDPHKPTMFSKLHHHQTFSAAAPPSSQEAESNDSADPLRRATSHDGATIEILRRPRGRPPGSKNKPKPPVIITRDVAEPPMSPYVLEIPGGVDIVDAAARFCRRRNVGLCLLSGSGAVSDVTLKQPSTTPGATVTFHGRFDILSVSATFLPPAAPPVAASPFALSLAGPQGQVVGGHVVGPLISAGTIYLVATNFSNPSFHRLQAADHEPEGSDSGDAPPTAGGTSMYSYQQADVVWAPSSRQQQSPLPPPPHY